MKQKKLSPQQKRRDRNNKILLALCCGYMTLLIGLLIPSAVISASPAEFTDAHYFRNPALYLVGSAWRAAVMFMVVGFGLGMLLSYRKRKVYTTAAAAVAAVSAVNYMFFGNNYGSLSSSLTYETAISNPPGRVFLNIAVVLAVIAAVVLLRKKHSLILRILCLYGCLALTVMSVINISGIKKQTSEIRDITDRIKEEDASFRLDREGKNVVVIMLDRAVGALVPYLMNEKPELKEQFDGFTYYPNTLSYGYHTNIAAPALFGGYEYTPDGLEQRAELTLKEKHNEALKIMPLNFLKAGYEVTVCDAPYANYQWIADMSIYDDEPAIRTYNTIGMFDGYKLPMLEQLDRIRNRNLFCYGLFRSAPLILQPLIYDNGRYLESSRGKPKEQLSNVYEVDPSTYKVMKFQKTGGLEDDNTMIGVSENFMNSYMVMESLSQLTEVTEDGTNTFLMLTNEMTHDVMELQEPDYVPAGQVDNTAYEAEHRIRRTEDGQELDLEEAGELAQKHYQSDMAALICLGRWFDNLRAQGVYDNTRIILVSDHACYLGLSGVNLADRITDRRLLARYLSEEWTDTTCYNPLLMVKDFGASGFTTDRTFMTNAETPGLAFEGTVKNPVNPFTGSAIVRKAGIAGEHHIVESEWHISDNCGNVFSDPVRITFRGTDLSDPESWSVEEKQ